VIRQKYAYTEGKRDQYEDAIDIEVPPYQYACIEIHWKNIFENWVVVMVDQYGQRVFVPFSFLVRKSFDQENHFDSADKRPISQP
jgi:hypothetical protein